MEEVIKPRATITWYECDKTKPAIQDGSSENILLLHVATHRIDTGKYWEGEAQVFLPFKGNWHPTHWAYLNYPEQAQD